jgi:hypothetical protein
VRRYENAWALDDERFEGLLAIANAINDAIDLAGGSVEVVEESEFEPDLYPMWTPLRLAERMRAAAERIEEATER